MKKVEKKTVKKAKIDKIIVNKIKIIKKYKGFKWAIVILVALGLAYYFKTSLVVAWVNGKPLSRISYNQELERLAGKQALESLMIKTMIAQEAKKQSMTVDQKEIDEEIIKIEEFGKQQGMSLDDLLSQQGVKKADLLADIRLQKLVDQMAGTEAAQIQEWIANLQIQSKVVNWLE